MFIYTDVEYTVTFSSVSRNCNLERNDINCSRAASGDAPVCGFGGVDRDAEVVVGGMME